MKPISSIYKESIFQFEVATSNSQFWIGTQEGGKHCENNQNKMLAAVNGYNRIRYMLSRNLVYLKASQRQWPIENVKPYLSLHLKPPPLIVRGHRYDIVCSNFICFNFLVLIFIVPPFHLFNYCPKYVTWTWLKGFWDRAVNQPERIFTTDQLGVWTLDLIPGVHSSAPIIEVFVYFYDRPLTYSTSSP